jgi:hypothetical protein
MDTTMSAQTKHEVLTKLRDRHTRTGKEHKTKILNQVVELFGLHRPAAIARLVPPTTTAGQARADRAATRI